MSDESKLGWLSLWSTSISWNLEYQQGSPPGILFLFWSGFSRKFLFLSIKSTHILRLSQRLLGGWVWKDHKGNHLVGWILVEAFLYKHWNSCKFPYFKLQYPSTFHHSAHQIALLVCSVKPCLCLMEDCCLICLEDDIPMMVGACAHGMCINRAPLCLLPASRIWCPPIFITLCDWQLTIFIKQ